MEKMIDMTQSSHQERIEMANRALSDPSLGVKNDRFRLHYHFMPPTGWMNDPNGLIQYRGEYHVFYQHDPYGPQQGPMHWGHAKSRDLIRWEHLPVALAPSETYDWVAEGIGGGCWSGSAVDDDGLFTLIYTGHVDGRRPEEVQCLATSTDGIRFEKAAFNPVIEGPPEPDGFGFRDPKVWKRGDCWYMVVGFGKGGFGKALFYRSFNLREWEYVGPAAESDGTMGDMWECPDLFPLGEGNRHVLVISPMNMGETKTMYLSGDFDYETGRLSVEHAERLDYGFDFYAPQTFLDDRGRRLLFGWMNIWGSAMPERGDGWMGAFTIPREIQPAEGGKIRMVPVPELRELRGGHHAVDAQRIPEGAEVPLAGIRAEALELIAVFDVSASKDAEFGILLRCSEDDSERTEVRYCPASGILSMDRNRSGIGDKGISETSIAPTDDGRIKLHLFLDRSSVELFANDGVRTITNRIYPDPSSRGIKLFARSGPASLVSLDVWELKSIW